LICSGHKRFENRSWSTAYRGPLLIHAGKSSDSIAAGRRLAESLGIEVPRSLSFGAVIGTVNLVDCTPVSQVSDPFATGPFCFHLADPVLFAAPLPWRGALGLVEPSSELLDAISDLAETASSDLPHH
jgi:hypothetical protein